MRPCGGCSKRIEEKNGATVDFPGGRVHVCTCGNCGCKEGSNGFVHLKEIEPSPVVKCYCKYCH